MQIIQRAIQLAKERALFRFSALAQSIANDAHTNIGQALTVARSGLDERTLSTALQFLNHGRNDFEDRIKELFAQNVDRAMQTMYTDLRPGLAELSADNLALIDDETVNRQIEVGHLVQRLRDACEADLGRLNLMIAQLHGEIDVRERENPFRPYLIARALHEVLKEKVMDELAAKALFEQLSGSLVKRLPEFYAELCDVFASSGVHARLAARPGRMKRPARSPRPSEQRTEEPSGAGGSVDQGGPVAPVHDAYPTNISPRMMSALQRLLNLLQQGPPASVVQVEEDTELAGTGLVLPTARQMQPPEQSEQSEQSESFQDFVWKLFNQGNPAVGPLIGRRASDHAPSGDAPVSIPASPALISQLNQFQQLAASGQAVSDQISPDQNQLFAVSEQIAPEHATKLERVAIDVVAVLFEFILEDEQIPATMRVQIGRLQIPFLKAAMLSPALLQDADHPTRQLLNRMSSVTIGLDADTPMGQALAAEITQLVKKILVEFNEDIAIFSECLETLERFLGEQLRHADAETARSVQAMEQAEKTNVLLLNTAALVREILTPFSIDQRVSDFILDIWVRVLVRASARDVPDDAAPDNSRVEQYREVLPELVWSAQHKQTPEQRNELIRLLPGLVKRLKIGLLMIQLPQEQATSALDRLVAVHTQVLRSGLEADAAAELPTLDYLRQQFARLAIDKESAAWLLTEPPQVQPEVVEKALADQGASASVDIERSPGISFESDAEWLEQMKLGTSVECWAADTYVVARLIWISKHQSLYILKIEANAKPLIYSSVSLIKSLREGSIRLVEYATVFDRAVDSLMFGAETVQPGRR